MMKMMKKLTVVLLLSLGLFGCELEIKNHTQQVKNVEDVPIRYIYICCLNGVQYYYAIGHSGVALTPVLDQEGKVQACSISKENKSIPEKVVDTFVN